MLLYLKYLILAIVFGSLPYILTIFAFFNYCNDYIVFKLFESEDINVYDFIIVGGGSAGAILANRLSKHNNVLLLEAGGDPVYLTSIPGLSFSINSAHNEWLDWNYKTIPQKYSAMAIKKNKVFWPRGKTLGGSSVLNSMLYLRGNPLDYDQWANITQDSSWNYKNVLYYFKKSIIYNGEFTKNEKHYSKSIYGEMNVESGKYAPFKDYFINAGKEFGYEEIDANGPQRTGFGSMEYTTKNGKRVTSFSAFLENIQNRKNLKISRYSHVVKIDLDKTNKMAKGVWYIRHGVKKYASSSKEVIISAGTINTPQLLMLSGIGPSKHLKSIGIKPIINLPVGQNLQDHPTVATFTYSINESLSFIPGRDLGLTTFIDYYFHGKGFLSNPTAIGGQAFISTSIVKKTKLDWPDIQIYIFGLGTYMDTVRLYSEAFGYKNNFLEQIVKKDIGKDGFLLIITLVRPKSIGEIYLNNKNPFSNPNINPNYFENEDDLNALVEGVMFSVNLIEKSKSFQKIGAKFTESSIPGCEFEIYRSIEYWKCFIRHISSTLFHPVGTCRMGKDGSDPNAVVDSKLRVINTTGLRIVDASIMPIIVNANTNAPCIMIAEKSADSIREYWSNHMLVTNVIDYLLFNDVNKCYYQKLI